MLCLGGVVPTVALFADGCRTPTQVTLEISTNVACEDQRGVDIVVGPEPVIVEQRAGLVEGYERFAQATTNECTPGPEPRRIGTLVVTPGEDRGAVVVVAAFGRTSVESCKMPGFGPECIVARRRFSFIENAKLTLPIVLDPSCAGVPCDANSTCVGKRCVDSAVECVGDTCTPPETRPDGGPPVDPDGGPPPEDGGVPPSDSGADVRPDAPPFEAGAGAYCPANMCASSGGLVAACLIDRGCCYQGAMTSCTPPASCGFLFGCCRGSEDCQAGDVCCADTPVAGPGTHIMCRPPQSCTGPIVCTQEAPGCNGAVCDQGSPYSNMPDFFRCS